MPKLPTYEVLGERPMPQPSAAVVSYKPNTGQETAEGAALAQVGKDISSAGDDIYKVAKLEEERLANSVADDALNKLKTKQIDLTYGTENGFTLKRGADAVTQPLLQDYGKRFQQAAEELSGGLKTDRQRELFNRRAAVVNIEFQEKLARHVAGEADNYAKQVFADTKQTELASIATNFDNPMLVALSVERVNNAIDREAERLGVPDLKDQEKRQFVDQAWRTRLDAWRMKDPVGALAAYQANAEQISPAVRQQYGESLFRDAAPVLASQLLSGPLNTVAANAAEGEAITRLADNMGIPVTVKVDANAAKNTLFDALPGDQKLRVLALAQTQASQQNALARHDATALLRDADAAAADGKTMAIPDATFTALGPQADEARKRYQASQQLARDIASVSTLPVAERIALAEQRLPPEGAPGYADAAKRADILNRAVIEANRRQADDPAAFTVQNAPQTAGAAYTALQAAMTGNATPEARRSAAQAYAAATVAEQERLGSIPRRNGQRLGPDVQILPKPMADVIARQFTTPTEGGQGPAQLIQQQADMWGAYWPQVYRQIAKDIGPTARVVANLRDTPAAAMLSMNAKVKTEDLKKTVPATDAKTVSDTVESELVPFRQSLVGWTTEGVQTYNDFEEAAKRNAYVHAAKGMKPGDAAKQAASEVIGDYYDFRGTVRIPKLPTVDPRAVETGMAAALKDADKLGVMVPEAEAKLLGPEFTAKQLAASVKANGFFVTLGDDSGVALYLNGNNGSRAVEGKDGRPVTFTWQQLTDMAAAAALRPGAVSFGTSAGGAATGMTKQRRGEAK